MVFNRRPEKVCLGQPNREVLEKGSSRTAKEVQGQRKVPHSRATEIPKKSKGSPKERSWRKARPLSVVIRTKTEQQSERLTGEDQGRMFEGEIGEVQRRLRPAPNSSEASSGGSFGKGGLR